MRTLDEVIEIASDWTNGFDESSIEKQMLYYLKMYRSDQEQWGFFQKNYEDELKQKIKDFGDAKERYIKRLKELDIGTLNEPLSWEQLKQMEGKPVWVEWTKTEESYWCFVGEWFDDDEMRIYHIGRDYADYIHKTVYTPDIVQAYRKERENETN